MPADELQGVPFNLLLWRIEHDHRAGEVRVEQRKQTFGITTTCAGGPHQGTGNLDPGPGSGDRCHGGIGEQVGGFLVSILVGEVGPSQN